MKNIMRVIPFLIALLLLSVGAVIASPHLPQPSLVGGLFDEDGHGHDDEEDAHADDDDDHHDEDSDDEHGHGEGVDGYEHDDSHHGQPFSLASLTPLLAGIGAGAVGAVFARSRTRNGLFVGIVALTLVTGVAHLLIGLGGGRLLLLNGLGFIGLLGLLIVPLGLTESLKNVVRLVLIGYTVVTIAGYFYLHSVAQFEVLALSLKAVELLLVVLLAMRIVGTRNANI